MGGGVFSRNPPEHSAVGQARSARVVEPEDAADQLARGVQARDRLAVGADHPRVGIDLQAAERERDAAGHRVGLERRGIQGVCPTGFIYSLIFPSSSVFYIG